jgi:hypothetical protein
VGQFEIVQKWGKGHGEVWSWTSLDADSKLIINWRVGGRDAGLRMHSDRCPECGRAITWSDLPQPPEKSN